MEELRKTFHEQLDELYMELLRMGSILMEMIERTRICFSSLDEKIAEQIIDADDIIDEFCQSIEKQGVELIALQAPVAIDLRLIIVIMRIAEHFERMADLCVNIARAIKKLKGANIPLWVRNDIDEMARRTNRLVERAIECFKERDVEMAVELETLDDVVDKLNRGFFKKLDKGQEKDTEVFVRVIMISRFFERIADHAVDIGEQVRYMIGNEF